MRLALPLPPIYICVYVRFQSFVNLICSSENVWPVKLHPWIINRARVCARLYRIWNVLERSGLRLWRIIAEKNIRWVLPASNFRAVSSLLVSNRTCYYGECILYGFFERSGSLILRLDSLKLIVNKNVILFRYFVYFYIKSMSYRWKNVWFRCFCQYKIDFF